MTYAPKRISRWRGAVEGFCDPDILNFLDTVQKFYLLKKLEKAKVKSGSSLLSISARICLWTTAAVVRYFSHTEAPTYDYLLEVTATADSQTSVFFVKQQHYHTLCEVFLLGRKICSVHCSVLAGPHVF